MWMNTELEEILEAETSYFRQESQAKVILATGYWLILAKKNEEGIKDRKKISYYLLLLGAGHLSHFF